MILKIMINDGWNKKPEGWEEVNIYDHKNITDKLDIDFNKVKFVYHTCDSSTYLSYHHWW